MKIPITSLINDIQRTLSAYLPPHDYESDAWWIAQTLLKKSKLQLIVEDTVELTPDQQKALACWIEKITKEKIPLQYLIGHVPFLNLDILVEPPILIPRPETEEWVERLCTNLRSLDNKELKILDVGTGSGCIALALAAALPAAHITAVDINPQALSLARANAKRNNLSNVEYIQSDLFTEINHRFDLIVSNPPYIAYEEAESLDTSVVAWEDKNALFAADHGLAIIKKLLTQAPHYLQNHKELLDKGFPNIIIEIGYKQGPSVVKLMEQAGIINITIQKDYAGNNRIAQGTAIPC